jgi:hypothetical protein
VSTDLSNNIGVPVCRASSVTRLFAAHPPQPYSANDATNGTATDANPPYDPWQAPTAHAAQGRTSVYEKATRLWAVTSSPLRNMPPLIMPPLIPAVREVGFRCASPVSTPRRFISAPAGGLRRHPRCKSNQNAAKTQRTPPIKSKILRKRIDTNYLTTKTYRNTPSSTPIIATSKYPVLTSPYIPSFARPLRRPATCGHSRFPKPRDCNSLRLTWQP